MSLVDAAKAMLPEPIGGDVVGTWLETTRGKDPDFPDFFVNYSRRGGNKRAMYVFAMQHGYRGSESHLAKYMREVQRGER